MSRRRVRGSEYRARRQKRHATRHYVIDQPFSGSGGENDPFVGHRITEYRRGVVVGLDIDPGTLDSVEAEHAIEVSLERGNQQVCA